MNPYFSQFPIIRYNNNLVIDITNRAAILNSVVNDKYAFYPYAVKDGMAAWLVAEKYYGDADFVWLVYLSNNIIDPYYQWPLSDVVLEQKINDDYGSITNAQNHIVFYRVNWSGDDRILSKNQYDDLPSYEKKYWDPQMDQFNAPASYIRKQIDIKSTNQPVDEELSYWESVSAYDVELEANADKSHIRLLDSRLAQTAADNLKKLLTS